MGLAFMIIGFVWIGAGNPAIGFMWIAIGFMITVNERNNRGNRK
jgi:hypothetical protein